MRLLVSAGLAGLLAAWQLHHYLTLREFPELHRDARFSRKLLLSATRLGPLVWLPAVKSSLWRRRAGLLVTSARLARHVCASGDFTRDTAGYIAYEPLLGGALVLLPEGAAHRRVRAALRPLFSPAASRRSGGALALCASRLAHRLREAARAAGHRDVCLLPLARRFAIEAVGVTCLAHEFSFSDVSRLLALHAEYAEAHSDEEEVAALLRHHRAVIERVVRSQREAVARRGALRTQEDAPPRCVLEALLAAGWPAEQAVAEAWVQSAGLIFAALNAANEMDALLRLVAQGQVKGSEGGALPRRRVPSGTEGVSTEGGAKEGRGAVTRGATEEGGVERGGGGGGGGGAKEGGAAGADSSGINEGKIGGRRFEVTARQELVCARAQLRRAGTASDAGAMVAAAAPAYGYDEAEYLLLFESLVSGGALEKALPFCDALAKEALRLEPGLLLLKMVAVKDCLLPAAFTPVPIATATVATAPAPVAPIARAAIAAAAIVVAAIASAAIASTIIAPATISPAPVAAAFAAAAIAAAPVAPISRAPAPVAAAAAFAAVIAAAPVAAATTSPAPIAAAAFAAVAAAAPVAAAAIAPAPVAATAVVAAVLAAAPVAAATIAPAPVVAAAFFAAVTAAAPLAAAAIAPAPVAAAAFVAAVIAAAPVAAAAIKRAAIAPAPLAVTAFTPVRFATAAVAAAAFVAAAAAAAARRGLQFGPQFEPRQETEPGPTRIPRGTVLVVSPFLLHRHPDGWGEDAAAGRADPGHFLPAGYAQRAIQEEVIHEGVIHEGGLQEGGQDGVIHEGVIQEGGLQEGVIQEGVIPEGVIHEGVTQEGVIQEGVIQEGAIRVGVTPVDVIPEGVVPEGAIPEEIIPVGIPVGVTPERRAVASGLLHASAMCAEAPRPAATGARVTSDGAGCPQRFGTGGGGQEDSNISARDLHFLPFSHGAKRCPASQIALGWMRLVLAAALISVDMRRGERRGCIALVARGGTAEAKGAEL